MRSAGYTIFDMQRKELFAEEGRPDDAAHLENFLDCISSGERPAADIQIGHDSALLCHYGNISYRDQKPVKIDPQSGRIQSETSLGSWERNYEPGWRPSRS